MDAEKQDKLTMEHFDTSPLPQSPVYPADVDRTINIRKQPYQLIRHRVGWSFLDLKQLWRFRELLVVFTARDVKLRYRQTILGSAWVILQPLLGAGILSLVFGRIAKLPTDGIPYLVFVYAGLLAWNAFNNTLNKASLSLVQHAGLIRKVAFPRLILPLSAALLSLVDFSVAFIMMLALLAVYHIVPKLSFLLFPLWLFFTLLLATGIGLFTSTLMVRYRDFQHVLPVLLQFLLFASPIAYSISAVPHSLRPLYFLNPLADLIQIFRWSLLGSSEVDWSYCIYAMISATLVFLVGAFTFRRFERQFADVI